MRLHSDALFIILTLVENYWYILFQQWIPWIHLKRNILPYSQDSNINFIRGKREKPFSIHDFVWVDLPWVIAFNNSWVSLLVAVCNLNYLLGLMRTQKAKKPYKSKENQVFRKQRNWSSPRNLSRGNSQRFSQPGTKDDLHVVLMSCQHRMHAVSTREETVKAIVLFSILAVGPTINVDSLRWRTCSHGTVHQINITCGT